MGGCKVSQTAVQNLAQDFHWFPGFIDATAPLIATATALLIAFVAYPWQKTRDRHLKMNEEKRAAYQRFLRALTEHQMRLAACIKHRKDFGIGELGPEAIAMSYELVTYAPKSVIEVCQVYVSTLYVLEEQVWSYIRGEVESLDYETVYRPSRIARRNVVHVIRKDIGQEADEEAAEAVAAFFGDEVIAYEDIHNAALAEVLKEDEKTK